MSAVTLRDATRPDGGRKSVAAAADVRVDERWDAGFRLGSLRVNRASGEVGGPSATRQLDPKVAEVLFRLAQSPRQVISRQSLLSQIWPGTVVGDDALSRCIYELRRRLHEADGSGDTRELIETLPKRGYRLNADVLPLTAAAPPVAASIAVLPFVDLSASQDQRYLADGVAEEILNRLAHSRRLRVIARTSSFTFRDSKQDIGTIAATLGVNHVLEGSVRRSGEKVRITAQLIAACNGSHVWSETYERQMGDVFVVEDQVAGSIAEALKVALQAES